MLTLLYNLAASIVKCEKYLQLMFHFDLLTVIQILPRYSKLGLIQSLAWIVPYVFQRFQPFRLLVN